MYSIPHCFNNIGSQSGRLPAYTWSIVDMSIGLAMTNPYISILISFQHLKFCSFTERSAFLTYLENSKNLAIPGQDSLMAAGLSSQLYPCLFFSSLDSESKCQLIFTFTLVLLFLLQWRVK